MAAAAGMHRPCLWLAVLCLVLPCPGSALDDRLACTVPDDLKDIERLKDIYGRNCNLVDGLRKEIQEASDNGLLECSAADQQRAVDSQRLCDDAYLKMGAGDPLMAAKHAVHAWRTTATGESSCCTLASPPYCTEQRVSASTKAMLAPVAVTLVFVVCVTLQSCCEKMTWWKKWNGCNKEDEAQKKKAHDKQDKQGKDGPVKWTKGTANAGPKAKMIDAWNDHCLKQMPGKRGAVSGEDVAEVFHEFTLGFGFQEHNARNQYEHFLSLWRSQVAMEADKEVQEGRDGGNKQHEFLQNSLDALHEQLLEGFGAWRTKFKSKLGAKFKSTYFQPDGVPKLLQNKGLLKGSIDHSRQRELAEMVVFLLVWGEAGNLRFMPEVLYFITDLVLASDPIDDAQGHDTWFLGNIVRPIYNAVFDEHYKRDKCFGAEETVDGTVVAWNDLKKGIELKDDCKDYLPGYAANHDDWNELFCDPSELRSKLKFGGGALLFNEDHENRLRRLPDVDWGSSLKNVKTHRELHSLVGVFATTHRVILLHMLMFAVSMCLECGGNDNEKWWMASSPRRGQIGGDGTLARFAFVGLLVPFHAFARALALWRVTNRKDIKDVAYLVPLATFVLLRTSGSSSEKSGLLIAGLHILVSVIGFVFLLLVPNTHYRRFPFENPTPVPPLTKSVRYAGWFCTLAVKFYTGLNVIIALNSTINGLLISRPGHESVDQISQLYFSATWCKDVMLWFVLWGVTFALYFVDTQYWFLLLCTIVGVCTTLKRRIFANGEFSNEGFNALTRDGTRTLKSNFQKKVLYYLEKDDTRRDAKFRTVWDHIVKKLRDDDDISYADQSNLEFTRDKTPPVLAGSRCVALACPERDLPKNDDARWRLLALSRGLRLPMQRPYRTPYIPGITVLVPFFSEDIYTNMQSRELLYWLTYRYKDEFDHYMERADPKRRPAHRDTGFKSTAQTDKEWTAVRQQTLFRTIEGMSLYSNAIDIHHKAQGIHNKSNCCLLKGNWQADVFTLLVAMQVYGCKNTGADKLAETNELFKKFCGTKQTEPTSCPTRCLKVAYIGYSSRGKKVSDTRTADIDNVRQSNRYYSCLVDHTCLGKDQKGRVKEPKFQIELPGFPVLGDGKGDNQNHCIPFMRGHYVQTMDMNQGAYLEQMLLLPCALGEFRTNGKSILGFPEQITSDIGSVGDFAASAESAFGTLLQRAYNVLGARMHYGHPDIMNKLYMMQQGGVSKATKTLHLSEDIFAGMDFTLRGDGRQIKHCEYMHFSKGRDMGFISVLTFFSKLSLGTGEQVLTRQTFRLEQVLELPEALCFYHAHAGYYLIQFMISWAMPVIVFIWLLVLVSACEGHVCVEASAVVPDNGEHLEVRVPTSESMMPLLTAICSRTLIMFLLISSLPWIAESAMQRGLLFTVRKLLRSYSTASPLLFIFQSKCIGHYIMNECRYGGAGYLPTGRGLPTERVAFIEETEVSKPTFSGPEWGKRKFKGLYHTYSNIGHYDAVMLMIGIYFVWLAEGIPTSVASSQTSLLSLVWSYLSSRLFWIFFCCGLVIISWLWGPYVFNPYQFKADDSLNDLKFLKRFFCSSGGEVWLDWYWQERLKPNNSSYRLHNLIWDIGFVLFVFAIASWYMIVTVKVGVLTSLFSEGKYDRLYAYALFPPVILSFTCCVVALVIHLLWDFSCFEQCRTRALDGMRRAMRQSLSEPLVSQGDGKKTGDGPRSAMVDDGFLSHCPLTVLAVVVVLVDCWEVHWTLMDLRTIGWTKTLLAGLVLKMIGLSAMTMIGEGTLRSPAFRKWPQAARTVLEAWVCAHRMAKDALTCLVILPPLILRVLLDSLNRKCLPKYNLHHQLLYRDWGHEKEFNEEKTKHEQDKSTRSGRLPGMEDLEAAIETPGARR